MATVGSADVDINADVAPMLRQIRKALKGLSIDLPVSASTRRRVREVNDELTKTQRVLRTVGRVSAATFSSMGKLAASAGASIGNAASSVLKMATQFVVLGVAAGAASLAVLRFVAAIAPGVFSVAAGAIAILVAGVALAIPAFKNFGAAVKGDDEALADLSQSARDAVNVLRSFSSVFNGIQAEAQETAFKNTSAGLTTLRDNLQRLNPQVLGISAALNVAMVGALDAVNNRFSDVESIATSAVTTFGNLARSLRPLIEGLLAVSAAGARIAASFSDEVATRIERAGNAMKVFADTGGVEKSVDKAGEAFSRLGGVARGLSVIFEAALDVAKQFGQGFSESFSGTADVETTLKAIGESLRDFGPAAKDFGAAVGNIAKGFNQIRPAVIPVVEGIAFLAKTLTSITGVNTIIALSIALNRLGVSFSTQRAAITAVTNALRAVAGAAGRARIVSGFGTAVRFVAGAISALIAAVGGVVAAIVIITALVAVFIVALAIFPEFRQKVLDVVKGIGSAIATAFGAVVDFFKSLPGLVLGFASAFLTSIVDFFQLLPGRIINAIVTLPGLLIEFFLSTLGSVLAFIITAVGEIIVFFILLPGRIIDAISGLAGLLLGFFGTTFSSVAQFVTTGIANIISFFQGLPARVISALVSLPGLLVTVANNAFNFFKNAITQGIAGVITLIQGIPAKVQSLLSGAANILFKAGQNIIQGLINGIKSMVGKVGEAISSVTGKIAKALPGSPVKEGPLSGSHQPNMLGEKLSVMISNGIKAGIPAVRKAAAGVASAAAGSVSGSGVTSLGPGPRVVRNSTNNTQVSVNVITGASDGNALAAILNRRLVGGV